MEKLMDNITAELTPEQKTMMNVISLNTAVNNLQTLTAHDHKLLCESNGEPSVIDRLGKLEDFINSIKFWNKTIGVSLIGVFISITASAVWLFVQVTPILQKIASGEIILMPK